MCRIIDVVDIQDKLLRRLVVRGNERFQEGLTGPAKVGTANAVLVVRSDRNAQLYRPEGAFVQGALLPASGTSSHPRPSLG